MNFICLAAQFYVALYPVGGPNLEPETFFELYLAGPFLIFLYVLWKAWSWFKVPGHRPLYVKIADIDIYTGMREGQADMISGRGVTDEKRRESIIAIKEDNKKQGPMDYIKATVRSVF